MDCSHPPLGLQTFFSRASPTRPKRHLLVKPNDLDGRLFMNPTKRRVRPL